MTPPSLIYGSLSLNNPAWENHDPSSQRIDRSRHPLLPLHGSLCAKSVPIRRRSPTGKNYVQTLGKLDRLKELAAVFQHHTSSR